ncbi:single-stranded DNA-binding protein WHY2, mitochondrial [Euphorbia lathyris]|uniref:single-stranded DNA-binding protein WHY2, mitochondrial n=1 Tax=Euphorbia lathyris TaxID=212925 RepID=UPI0033140917
MMKLSRLLQQSRNQIGNSVDAKDALKLCAFSSQANHSTLPTARQNYATKERIFAPYSVFKGKAALSFQPVMPTFIKLDSGHHRIERRGVMLLTFMPSVGERKYDYEKRQHFALSATEMGTVMSLGPTGSSEFFHDPSMLSSNAGQVRKSLSIKSQSDGGGGYFISLSVVNNILKFNDRFNVPLTAGEFTVLKTACSFALPYIMGWDQLTGKLPEGMANNKYLKVVVEKPAVADREQPDLEWDR